MGSESINYEAVLADIESRIEKLQAAAEAIRAIIAQGGAPTIPGGAGPDAKIAPDAFLKMSIPDATKKLLETTRQKQSTQAVIDALVAGGLPRSKYSTVYAILRRREQQVGDLRNMKGDWALAEWYPNFRKNKPKENAEQEPENEPVTKTKDPNRSAAAKRAWETIRAKKEGRIPEKQSA
jgi:hypothetical protein